MPIVISIAVLAGIAIGLFFNFPSNAFEVSDSDQREQKLRQIINFIDYEYVDDINTDSLLDLTLSDLLRKLDPHSTYIANGDVVANEEGINGSFEGIGIEYKIFRDTLTVIRTIEGGPSQKAGLLSGDRILVADNREMYGSELTSAQVVKALKGESGSKVTLSIYRPSNKHNDIINVSRDVIAIPSVRMSFMANDNIGYIKLVRFSKHSVEELHRAIVELKRKGAESLILDLRDNPGGLLSVANEIADEFLEEDELIVFTRDRKGDESSTYASGKGSFKKGKLVILINEGSASASEIVAGAVQDNDRGWIVGRRSFGKGLVQEEMTLADGSKVRLTTRKYFTPSGRSIQKPFKEYDAKYLHGDVYEDSGISADEHKNETYFTVAGRKVYGGGGIMPDIEVMIDTSREAIMVYHLSNLVGMSQSAFAYVDKNRAALSVYSEKAFLNGFLIDDEILDFFFSGHANRIKGYDQNVIAKLKERIKAFIAYELFGDSAYQKVNFSEDPNLIKAMEILQSESAEYSIKKTP